MNSNFISLVADFFIYFKRLQFTANKDPQIFTYNTYIYTYPATGDMWLITINRKAAFIY